jgi:cytochrome c oxidase cbb3-type subunit 3
MNIRNLVAILSVLTVGVIAACGGSSSDKTTPTVPATATTAATQAPAASPIASVAGKQLFADKCSACHGENAAGGYQMGDEKSANVRWTNLGDMYKGDVSQVANAIFNGLDEDGKEISPVMPRWKDKLSEQEVSDLIAYLETLTTAAPENEPVAAPAGAGPGEVLFYQNCAICHGADGAGDKDIGTSTSADLRWAKLGDMYQNDLTLIARAILAGKDEEGDDLDDEMPRWQDTLTSDQVQQIIAFLQTLT